MLDSAEPQFAPDIPSLDEVLDTIRQFGSASLGLVAWDLCVPDEQLRPLWEYAIGQGLIRPAERCPDTAEPMFSIAVPANRTRLRKGSRPETVSGA